MHFGDMKWTLDKDYRADVFAPSCEHEWASVHCGELTIKKGYSWDGCTPKLRVWFLSLGTWDGPINRKTGEQWCYYASLVHDALYQYRIGTRRDADKLFYDILEGFPLRRVYWLGVRMFGWVAKGWRKW